jgi:hypothetical protein
MEYQLAQYMVGCIVTASDKNYGSYIGRLEYIMDTCMPDVYRAGVTILACIKYPSQRAELQDTPKHREPYPYNSEQTFSLSNIEYLANTGDYSEYQYNEYLRELMSGLSIINLKVPTI